MGHTYNGDATGITPATAIQLNTEPDDGDALNVASVEPGVFHKLANWVKFLFSQAALFLNANGANNYANASPIKFQVATPGVSLIKGLITGLDANPVVDAEHQGPGPAVKATAGSVSRKAVQCVEGMVSMEGAHWPASTAIKAAMTPDNIIKGSALVTTGGGGVVTLVDDFNVAAVALVVSPLGGGGQKAVKITWAQAFANANYEVKATYGLGGGPSTYAIAVVVGRTANDVTIGFCDSLGPGGTIYDAAAAVTEVMVIATGKQ